MYFKYILKHKCIKCSHKIKHLTLPLLRNIFAKKVIIIKKTTFFKVCTRYILKALIRHSNCD
jgi:hypothetical protein